MVTRIRSITFDCADPFRAAAFCSELTGVAEDPDSGSFPGHPLLAPDRSLALLFLPVPEPERTKNRRNLDLVPVGWLPAQEVGHLLNLGAPRTDEGHHALRRPVARP